MGRGFLISVCLTSVSVHSDLRQSHKGHRALYMPHGPLDMVGKRKGDPKCYMSGAPWAAASTHSAGCSSAGPRTAAVLGLLPGGDASVRRKVSAGLMASGGGGDRRRKRREDGHRGKGELCVWGAVGLWARWWCPNG